MHSSSSSTLISLLSLSVISSALPWSPPVREAQYERRAVSFSVVPVSGGSFSSVSPKTTTLIQSASTVPSGTTTIISTPETTSEPTSIIRIVSTAKLGAPASEDDKQIANRAPDAWIATSTWPATGDYGWQSGTTYNPEAWSSQPYIPETTGDAWQNEPSNSDWSASYNPARSANWPYDSPEQEWQDNNPLWAAETQESPEQQWADTNPLWAADTQESPEQQWADTNPLWAADTQESPEQQSQDNNPLWAETTNWAGNPAWAETTNWAGNPSWPETTNWAGNPSWPETTNWAGNPSWAETTNWAGNPSEPETTNWAGNPSWAEATPGAGALPGSWEEDGRVQNWEKTKKGRRDFHADASAIAASGAGRWARYATGAMSSRSTQAPEHAISTTRSSATATTSAKIVTITPLSSAQASGSPTATLPKLPPAPAKNESSDEVPTPVP